MELYPIVRVTEEVRRKADRQAMRCYHNGTTKYGGNAWGLKAGPKESLAIDIHGLRCEGAFQILLPHAIWFLTDRKDLPDFTGFIDVKATRGRGRRLINPPDKIIPHWAYPLFWSLDQWDDDPMEYQFRGWAWGVELAKAPQEEFVEGRGKSCWLRGTIPPLHSLQELRLIESWKRNR
jgi:hypothetical protein